MLIDIVFKERRVPWQSQLAFGPNLHDHYVDLRPRTYRLFVLQPSLNLVQYYRRRRTGRRNMFPITNLQRNKCAVSPRAEVVRSLPVCRLQQKYKRGLMRKLG
jgi:hypothetical protein